MGLGSWVWVLKVLCVFLIGLIMVIVFGILKVNILFVSVVLRSVSI